jgi:hypothetical protein
MIKSAKAESVPVSDERESAHPGWWAAMTVLVTAWIGIPMALPVAAALPWVLFNWRRGHDAPSIAPTIRWCIAVWCTTVAMSALAGERAVRAVPFGAETVVRARAWLDGTGGAAPSLVLMGALAVLMIATAIPLRGVIASVVLANALAITAIHASVIFANSTNLLHASLVAMPLWTALWLVGIILLLDPLASEGMAAVRNSQAPERKRVMTAAVLILLAFVTRFALAGLMTNLAHQVARS